jgi:hypothetical protein
VNHFGTVRCVKAALPYLTAAAEAPGEVLVVS